MVRMTLATPILHTARLRLRPFTDAESGAGGVVVGGRGQRDDADNQPHHIHGPPDAPRPQTDTLMADSARLKKANRPLRSQTRPSSETRASLSTHPGPVPGMRAAPPGGAVPQGHDCHDDGDRAQGDGALSRRARTAVDSLGVCAVAF